MKSDPEAVLRESERRGPANRRMRESSIASCAVVLMSYSKRIVAMMSCTSWAGPCHILVVVMTVLPSSLVGVRLVPIKMRRGSWTRYGWGGVVPPQARLEPPPRAVRHSQSAAIWSCSCAFVCTPYLESIALRAYVRASRQNFM